jgi:serine/threonine-protein kinase RsbW
MAAPPVTWTMPALLRTAMFPARLGELEALRVFVEAFCGQARLARDKCLRLNLVLEELFTNTVLHGHRGDCESPVWVSLAAEGDALVKVSYEDTAPPFNPYAHLAKASADATLSLKAGGLGVLLTRELSASRDYAYVFGRNCIRLGLQSA